jgi:alpha-maltose-1-phosphate synthase
MSIRLCHPFGNPFSYNAAVSFLETGELERFHTLVYRPFGFQKRGHPELPRRYVTVHPGREVLRIGAAYLSPGRWNGRRQAFVDWVTRNFDESTAKTVGKSDEAVYCYEDSAAKTFQRAKEVGSLRIYELPIMHYREMHRILEVEKSKDPDLAVFLRSLQEPAWKLERKDLELLTADVIVVPARFVQRSIERFLKPSAHFIVVPYGSDTQALAKTWSATDQQGPLRLFFAGILGPRKGLQVLFAALEGISARHYRLVLAGRWEPGFREWLSRKYRVEYEWLGQLAHADVYRECRQAHVFVFPSLAEGFGLVILEAMASGVPVIATDHTAGPEIIEHAVDGWIVPAGDIESLKNSLELAIQRRPMLPAMGFAARIKAETRSWKQYRSELRTGIAEALRRRYSAGARCN